MGFAPRPKIVMTHDAMIMEAVYAHDLFLMIPRSYVPSVRGPSFSQIHVSCP